MTRKEKQLYEAVAKHNVYPERYGDLALQDTVEFVPIIQLPLPHLANTYDFPDIVA